MVTNATTQLYTAAMTSANDPREDSQKILGLSTRQWEIIIQTAYGLLFGVATILNVWLCTVLCKTRWLRYSFENQLILNLSIAHVIMCCTAVPLTPITAFHMSHFNSLEGTAICKAGAFFSALSVYASAQICWLMARHRYEIVFKFDRFIMTLQRNRRRYLIPLVWTFSVASATPLAITTQFYKANGSASCQETWSTSGKLIYSIYGLAVQYFLPIIIASTINITFYRRVRIRWRVLQALVHFEDAAVGHRWNTDVFRQSHRLIVTLLAIYMLSWLPHAVWAYLPSKWLDKVIPADGNIQLLVFFQAHLMAMTVTITIPLAILRTLDALRQDIAEASGMMVFHMKRFCCLAFGRTISPRAPPLRPCHYQLSYYTGARRRNLLGQLPNWDEIIPKPTRSTSHTRSSHLLTAAMSGVSTRRSSYQRPTRTNSVRKNSDDSDSEEEVRIELLSRRTVSLPF